MEMIYQYNLGQLFNEVASKNHDKIAVKSIDNESTSYDALNLMSNKIANYLVSLNVGRNDVVAILNNKTATSYSIMIACLKIGVTYTNLDPKSPIDRFKRMVEICNPKLLFYYSDENSVINEFHSDKIETSDYSTKTFNETIKTFEDSFPTYNETVTSNTPAYIMFTSGSTGFPKGVAISHQNILNFIAWSKITYQITTNDVFTNINPMHFDNSVFDFYSSLFTGAAIVPVGEKLTRNPRKLLDALNLAEPTVWFSVPSMLVYVLNMRALKEIDLPTLRVVTFGGEGFPKNQLRKLWELWGSRVRFVNVYGPTECTCICSSYDVSEADMISDELLPLGYMAPNFYGLVLDQHGNQVEVGETGELLIGGPNVGIGYYNSIEKTKEVFISNPIINTHDEIVYRSGDLVRQELSTKMFLFCGRTDNQIKRMGYRIELEEIENALNSFDLILESAVIYIDNSKHKEKIVAFVIMKIEDELQIKNHLKTLLPLYMMPNKFIFLPKLPKNQNGKIDRLELKNQWEN